MVSLFTEIVGMREHMWYVFMGGMRGGMKHSIT